MGLETQQKAVVESSMKIKCSRQKKPGLIRMGNLALPHAEYAKALYISLVRITVRDALTKKEFVLCVGRRFSTQRTTNRLRFDSLLLDGDSSLAKKGMFVDVCVDSSEC